jgi:hypothetical protein
MLNASRVLRGLAVVVVCAALSACGSNSNSADSTTSEMSNGTVACGTKNAPPCVPISTTQSPPPSCGGITTALLSDALGRTVTEEASDETGCRFAAGDLKLTLNIDPYNLSGMNGFGLAADKSTGQYRITNDRSGYWYAVGYTAGFQWVLVSYGRGSDTYPNTEGPEQRPIVSAAADAFVEAVAKSRPSD